MNYLIKKGDTLTSIAKAYNTTVDAIANANGIKNKNLIYAGDTLTIPDSNGVSPLITTKLSLDGAYKSPSDASKETDKAASRLNEWEKSRPKYSGKDYSDELDAIISAVSGRKFSYDPENDPAAKAYREVYLNDARLAMNDALGKAVSLTGGWGNSYADSAARQAWGNQVLKGAEIIPELYEAAYERYVDEGDSLMDRAKLLDSISDSEFERYNQAIKNYLTEGKMLMDNYADLSKEDFDRFLDYAKLLQSAAK